MADEKREPLLHVEHLCKEFPVEGGIFGHNSGVVHAVDDISFDIYPGETFGLVGESGCGKSTTGRCIMRLTEPTSGTVVFDGQDVSKLKGKELKKMRHDMQYIFQDPYASLNPRMTIGEIVSEPLVIHGEMPDKEQRMDHVRHLLDVVGLNPEHINRYPHEFSGGQRQRVGIARAFALRPKLIICDEPVSARRLHSGAGPEPAQGPAAGVWHGLPLHRPRPLRRAAHLRPRGRHVPRQPHGVLRLEDALRRAASPLHAVAALGRAGARPDVQHSRKRIILPGDPPSPISPPSGCRFHTRCPIAKEQCSMRRPELREVAPGHFWPCHCAAPNPIKETSIEL